MRLEQPFQVPGKLIAEEVSINGKLVVSPRVAMLSMLEHPCHVLLKPITEDESISGKEVRDRQSFQVVLKVKQDPNLVALNVVIEVQPCQAATALVAFEKSISGKDVNEVQPLHVPRAPASPKLVAPDKSSNGKLVKDEQFCQVNLIDPVSEEVSISGKEVRDEQSCQAASAVLVTLEKPAVNPKETIFSAPPQAPLMLLSNINSPSGKLTARIC